MHDRRHLTSRRHAWLSHHSVGVVVETLLLRTSVTSSVVVVGTSLVLGLDLWNDNLK